MGTVPTLTILVSLFLSCWREAAKPKPLDQKAKISGWKAQAQLGTVVAQSSPGVQKLPEVVGPSPVASRC